MAGGGGSPVTTAQSGENGAQPTSSGYAPAPAPATAQPTDMYSALARPAGDTIRNAYMQALGRAPEAAGAAYWGNEAQVNGLTGQQLAERINLAAAPERAQSGYQSVLNPQTYSAQRVATMPSYYNTNPVGVDYSNIFNPFARSVTTQQQTLTPQQQAEYMADWQRDYSNRITGGISGAKAARVASAQQAQERAATAKAQAEAQAATNNQAAIDAAVQQALAAQQQQQANYNTVDFFGGASGGIASLAKGFGK